MTTEIDTQQRAVRHMNLPRSRSLCLKEQAA